MSNDAGVFAELIRCFQAGYEPTIPAWCPGCQAIRNFRLVRSERGAAIYRCACGAEFEERYEHDREAK